MSARLRRYLTVLTLLGVALLVWGLSVAKVTERRENFWFARVKSKEPGLKAEAVYELCRLGSKAKSLIPDLTEMLKDEDPTNRCNSAEILGSIGPDAIEAVPCLADMLRDDDIHCRLSAIRALGLIGPQAKAAVPAIIGLLDDKRELHGLSVRSEAYKALLKIDAEALRNHRPE